MAFVCCRWAAVRAQIVDRVASTGSLRDLTRYRADGERLYISCCPSRNCNRKGETLVETSSFFPHRAAWFADCLFLKLTRRWLQNTDALTQLNSLGRIFKLWKNTIVSRMWINRFDTWVKRCNDCCLDKYKIWELSNGEWRCYYAYAYHVYLLHWLIICACVFVYLFILERS